MYYLFLSTKDSVRLYLENTWNKLFYVLLQYFNKSQNCTSYLNLVKGTIDFLIKSYFKISKKRNYYIQT